jgi:hypothetical protein
LLVQWSKFNLAEQIEKISNLTPVPQGFHLHKKMVWFK